ncbi:MAG: serine hydrolase domain-containing protein [Alphaproteobacteria bacterium]
MTNRNFPDRLQVAKALAIILFLIAGLSPSLAPAAQRPPAAAPTTNVQVQRLPTLYPEAQALDDFLTRNVDTWMRASDVPGVAIVVVKNGGVMISRGFGAEKPGEAINPSRTQFHLGSLAYLLADVAIMKLVDQGHLLLDQDIGAALGESDRAVTIADLLMRRMQFGEDLRGEIVERVSGMPAQAYIKGQILDPLGMTRSGFDKDGFLATPNDMARLMLALLGAGTVPSVLQAATRQEMLRVRGVVHAGLAGYALGFAEMHRNGWRGFLRDGQAPFAQSRMVLMPENETGYFIAIIGHAPPSFWQQLDDAVFARLFPSRPVEELAVSSVPAPTHETAEAVAGTFRIASPSPYDFLRSGDGRLFLEARDAKLMASGVEQGELRPHAGGIWRSEDGNVRLAAVNGQVLVDTRVYERHRFPVALVVFAALVALAAIGYSAYRIWRA